MCVCLVPEPSLQCSLGCWEGTVGVKGTDGQSGNYELGREDILSSPTTRRDGYKGLS